MNNQSTPHDHSACWANPPIYKALGALEEAVSVWASVKARTPDDVDRITRTAEKVIERGALIGSLTEPGAS